MHLLIITGALKTYFHSILPDVTLDVSHHTCLELFMAFSKFPTLPTHVPYACVFKLKLQIISLITFCVKVFWVSSCVYHAQL